MVFLVVLSFRFLHHNPTCVHLLPNACYMRVHVILLDSNIIIIFDEEYKI
jgi:hypothetical protein